MHTAQKTRNGVPSSLRCQLFALVFLASLCYLYLYVRDAFLRKDIAKDNPDALESDDTQWTPTNNPFNNRWWGQAQVPEISASPMPTPLVQPFPKAASEKELGKELTAISKTDVIKKGSTVRRPRKYADYVPPPVHPSYRQVIDALSADDKALLPRLQEEYKAVSVLDDPKCGNWQNRYRELHRNIVSNATSQPRTIMYLCRRNTNCGGLADRIVGMVSTFMFALLDDRAFLAKWEVPLPLETLFDAPSVDWRSNNRSVDIVRAQGFDHNQGKELNWIHYHKDQVESIFMDSETPWDKSFPEPHLTFMTNRGMALGLIQSENYAERLQEMGLTVDTIFGCTLDFIITPRPSILQFISKFVSVFRLPSVFSIGIQIRTGDDAMRDPTLDHTALSNYDHYFNCANQLSTKYAKENQIVVYFLVTDSIHLRNEAEKRYSNPSTNGNATRYVMVSGVPIAHTHRSKKISDSAGSIVENWVLAATDYRVISRGGYGKIAAFRSRAQNTTVVLTPTGKVKLHKLSNWRTPDCSKSSAFKSFENMASGWSLG